ncbi:hypothetical protein SDRG_14381 [Saprolegnia diclina VS20]|uniref:Uncharacterized protein n=1 Tax=Saprolegnia diclina (strain VS20) TaxID=1156394 RepID=T0RDV2_SAPDV|nr:hypothetical protein SDRG_14381 [Saprolegnia diclina VS20]EQC27797.1 hypothetical protein SDRG_14381 [Saprolegnia diclina VS20]|eukprot:XP_008618727.1 hypothetical protein SDRG_14381 [Saprolegnia diclina VS20]
MNGPLDNKTSAILGIPPPFPFCEAWPTIPAQSTTWLTPAFRVHSMHMPPAAPRLYDPMLDARHRHRPPQQRHAPSRLQHHRTPPSHQYTATPSANYYSQPLEPAMLAQSEQGDDSDSEYEYGFVLNDEWAEHFARKQAVRRATTKGAKSNRSKKDRRASRVMTPEPSPLLYELSVGALGQRTWQPEHESARVLALERQMEHAFTIAFSNPLDVCLYNS